MANHHSNRKPLALPRASGVEFRYYRDSKFYAVGSDGTVLSCKRGEWKPVTISHDKWNYPMVTIRIEGKQHRRFVHRLVLETFVGLRPAGKECRHLDGDQLNNRIENLEWNTTSVNAKDRTRHGTQANLIPEAVVRQIRQLSKTLSYAAISRQLGINPLTISAINRRLRRVDVV